MFFMNKGLPALVLAVTLVACGDEAAPARDDFHAAPTEKLARAGSQVASQDDLPTVVVSAKRETRGNRS